MICVGFFAVYAHFGVVIWILLQPNFSYIIVIFVIWISLVWICGLRSSFCRNICINLNFNCSLWRFPFLQPYQRHASSISFFPNPAVPPWNDYNVQTASSLLDRGSGLEKDTGHGNGKFNYAFSSSPY